MSDRSRIEWTQATWNVVRGCTPVSAGCANCYAARMAHRFSGKGKPYEFLTLAPNGKPKWTGEVRLIPELLDQPLHWRKPRRIFVGSMSDLFHEAVPDEFLDRVFAVMALAGYTRLRRWRPVGQQRLHTFQLLTKRPERMRSYLSDEKVANRVWIQARKLDPHGDGHTVYNGHLRPTGKWGSQKLVPPEWPLPWVWLGVPAENQEMLDRRVPDLLATPAAVRFVSLEPLVGEIDTRTWLNGWCPACGSDGWEGRFPRRNEGTGKPAGSHYCPHCGSNLPNFPTVQRGDYIFNALHWVIVGPETGPGARPCKIEWVRSIVEQCHNSDVPCFVKRVPGYSQDMATWPAWSQVREWPDHRSQERSIAQPGASSEASG